MKEREDDREEVRPFEKNEVERYERKRYRGLDQKIVDWREKRLLLKALRIIKKKGKEGDVSRNVPFFPFFCDAPCGYGRFSRILLGGTFLETSPSFLISCDLSLAMVRKAMERSPNRHYHFGVVADLKRGLPFKDASFEAVFSIRFFHHLHAEEERKAVLSEFRRASKEWVILSYYEMNAFHRLQRKIRRLFRKSRTQIKMIPRNQFEKELKEPGLEVIDNFPLFRGIHAYHLLLLRREKGTAPFFPIMCSDRAMYVFF